MPRPEYANSTKLVRPMMTVPAFFNRSTTLESRVAGGVPTSTFEPPSVVTPASSNRSLIEIGMPASAGSVAPSRVHLVGGGERFALMYAEEGARTFSLRVFDSRERLFDELAAGDFLAGKYLGKLDHGHRAEF